MKKDLDQLIAEYKRYGKKSPEFGDIKTPTRSELFQEMTWSERGKRLMELIEERNGSISQKELLFNEIEKLGITNSEEGRLYLRNFLSLFVQQKLLLKRRIKSTTYFFPNRQFGSANIQEYFDLLSAPSRKSESYRQVRRQKYNKRLELLVGILTDKGSLPISRLVEKHLTEFGFTSDLTGRHEGLLFFKNAIRDGVVQTYKKESLAWISLPDPMETSTEKEAMPSENAGALQRSDQKAERASEYFPVTRNLKKLTKASFSSSSQMRMQQELFVYQFVFELDCKINELDDRFIELSDQKITMRRQLAGLERKIEELSRFIAHSS